MYPKWDRQIGWWCPHFTHNGEMRQGSRSALYDPDEKSEFCRICKTNNSCGKHGCMNKGGSIQD